MSYRFMRILVLFDLPVITPDQRREYAKFRKFLIKSGFMMLQESVYCKLVLNAIAAETVKLNVRDNAPAEGLVQMINITEKQYAKMEFVVGESHSEVLNNDKRIVIL